MIDIDMRSQLLFARARARAHFDRVRRTAQRDFWIGMAAITGLVLLASVPLAWLVAQWLQGRF